MPKREPVTTVIAPAQCRSFAPAARADARVLILGSMPGIASLQAQRYYAHPRNLFWPFMGQLFDAGPEHDYAVRLQHLQAHGVAVWDVLAACERPGSLDGRIARASEVANDIAGFRAAHAQLETICLNGGKAAEAFARHVARRHAEALSGLRVLALPSTSAANAGQSRDAKFAAWHAALARYSQRSAVAGHNSRPARRPRPSP